MKGATHDVGFITLEKNIAGVNLGWEFAAEHEWGIKRLTEDFGITDNVPGFEGRKNTIAPKGLLLHHYIKGSYPHTTIMVYTNYLNESNVGKSLDKSMPLYGGQCIGSAWSERDFGVRVDKAHNHVLTNLYDAFQDNRGIIMLSGRDNPFANSGLLLLDYALIPAQIKEDFMVREVTHRREQELYRSLEEESGVFPLLKEAKRDYFSLSIKHLDDNGEPVWWLNPSDQTNNNYGWYHTNDLKQWALGKGPIVKKDR